MSYNTIGRGNFMLISPRVVTNAKLWKDKVNVSTAASYNISTATGSQQINIFNIRTQLAYTLLQKHQIGFSVNVQAKNSIDIISMLNYSYAF